MRALATPDIGRTRWVAFGAAAVVAVLYFLIGAGILPIGKPADGSAGDLVGFGLALGGTFVGVALLTIRAHARRWWLAIAGLQVVVLAGYFGFAALREPPVEVWGLTIKALQTILLVAAMALVLRGESARRAAIGAPARMSVGVWAGIGGGVGLVFALLAGLETPLGLVLGAGIGVVLGAVLAVAVPVASR